MKGKRWIAALALGGAALIGGLAAQTASADLAATCDNLYGSGNIGGPNADLYNYCMTHPNGSTGQDPTPTVGQPTPGNPLGVTMPPGYTGQGPGTGTAATPQIVSPGPGQGDPNPRDQMITSKPQAQYGMRCTLSVTSLPQIVGIQLIHGEGAFTCTGNVDTMASQISVNRIYPNPNQLLFAPIPAALREGPGDLETEIHYACHIGAPLATVELEVHGWARSENGKAFFMEFPSRPTNIHC